MKTWSALEWVSLGLLLLTVALSILTRLRSGARSMKSVGLLLAGLVLSTISKLIAESTLAVVLVLVAVPCLLAAVVFTVREARVTWREQLQRVKHL